MKHQPPFQLIKSTLKDGKNAVIELKKQITTDKIECIVFFCSSHYDLDDMANGFNDLFTCKIIGCTTAGEILGEYSSHSIVALVLSSDLFTVHSKLIEDIDNFNLPNAMQLATGIEKDLKLSNHYDSEKMFGFLLTDGMSFKVEKVTSLLYQVMGDIHIIGGSAGDDLIFDKTFIYCDEKFHFNAALMLVVEVRDDFEVFKMQHFEPTNKELITTKVDFERRIVNEINGEPAAIAYANINGLDSNKLTSLDYAMYPLMLNIADEWHIRSIFNILPDKSLQFHCAIDNGLPLSIAKGKDIVQRLSEEIDKMEDKFENIYFTLGCDCTLRKLEIFNKNHTCRIEEQLKRINFIGFNSYGEQFNGIHLNQTFVAVVIGEKKQEQENSE